MWPAARKTADLSHGSLQLPRHPVTAVFGTVIKETSCILNVILRQRIKTKKTVRNVEYMAAGKYNVEIFVNNQLDAQFFFMYVYFYSLHVSGSHVPIIRRINCINTTSGVCRSVYMTVQCEGLDKIQTCTLNGHLYRVTYTRYRIDIINSPDDGHMAVRNM